MPYPIDHNVIKVERHASVYSLGDQLSDSNYVWIVFHGYGQLASRIIQKFNRLDLDKHHVIAPEGLNKFYLETREVGATWMTKHDRLYEIEDYLSYLDQIYDMIDHLPDKKLCLLGFSQGCQTMHRWINHRKPSIHACIQWAGSFPAELDFTQYNRVLEQIKHYYLVLGDQDQYIKDEIKDSLFAELKDNSIPVEIIHFNGKHQIDRNVLETLFNQIT